jgi:hypothetical protein
MKQEKDPKQKQKKKSLPPQSHLRSKYEKDKAGKWNREMNGPDISEFNDQPILDPNRNVR